MPTKIILESVFEIECEDDGGNALIARIDGAPLFVRIQSWDETQAHVEFRRLVGQRVRVTIEVLPSEASEKSS